MKIKGIISSYIPNELRFFKDYSKLLKDLEVKDKMSESEIKIWQLKKLNEELLYANNYVPYYKKLFADYKIKLPLNNLKDFENIPYLTKDLIRENYNELKSIRKIKSHIDNTGGSSGTPLKLEKSYFSLMREEVFLDFYMKKLGLKSFKCKKVIIRGNIPRKGICERVGNQLILSSYLINEDNIHEYIKELEKFNPTMLHVYPSSIYMLCKIIIDKNLEIKLPKLKVIFSSSEIFTKEQKEIVYKVFKCSIFDLYGNTEKSVHGTSVFPSLGYNFTHFYSYVELTSQKEIVTTTFDERVMPLIRYKTGDEVEFIDETNFVIKGRVQDYIYGYNDTKYPVVGLIFGQHFSFFKDINKFQIIQNKIGHIYFVIESNQHLEKIKEREIIDILTNATLGNLKVEIDYTEHIERTKRGKYKFLVQNINILE